MGRGTSLVHGTGHSLLAHFFSKPARLELVSLALYAAKKEVEDQEERTGKIRPGPKGNETTHLSQRLGVARCTVKTWIKGEEPSDHSTAKLLHYLHLQDGPIKQRIHHLIKQDLTLHQDAVAQFYEELGRGTSPIQRKEAKK